VDELGDGSKAVTEATNWQFIGQELICAFFHKDEHAYVYRKSDGAWTHNHDWISTPKYRLNMVKKKDVFESRRSFYKKEICWLGNNRRGCGQGKVKISRSE